MFIRFTALVLLVVTSLGCSWITAFAISNRSASPIKIRVDFVPETDRDRCPLAKADPPAFASTETMGWWRPRANWRELAADEYHFDPDACSLLIEVPPAMALRVARTTTYTGHRSGRWGLLGDLRVTIASRYGELTVSGLELVWSFEKRSDTLYEFPYRAPDFASPPAA